MHQLPTAQVQYGYCTEFSDLLTFWPNTAHTYGQYWYTVINGSGNLLRFALVGGWWLSVIDRPIIPRFSENYPIKAPLVTIKPFPCKQPDHQHTHLDPARKKIPSNMFSPLQ